MALLLGPMLYAHIFNRGMGPGCRDFGQVAAESFWRAYGQSNVNKAPRVPPKTVAH